MYSKMIFKKPRLIFFSAIPLLLIAGYLSMDATIDFNIGDTYYVIGFFSVAFLLSLILLFLGGGYWMMWKAKRKIDPLLTWLHIGLTFGGVLLALLLYQFCREGPLDYEFYKQEYEFNQRLTLAIQVVLLFVVLGQVLFLLNIFFGWFGKGQRNPG